MDLEPNNLTNETISSPVFDDRALVGVVIYSCVFVVSSVGNLTVFITMCRSKRRKSCITLLIIHLAFADLIVTFILIPLEIIWRITVQWMAGNVACKILLFLRAFGLYLSSNVLVCISMDRYFAILHPLTVTNARSRGKIMLGCAYLASFVCAMPQSFIFHTESHPQFSNFTQCVTFGYFQNTSHETIYNFLCVVCMYFIPLSAIAISYPAIWWEIRKKTMNQRNRAGRSTNNENGLRRSDNKTIQRAKIRTLRMTIMIVVVFVVCWTPYVVLTLWYMVGRDSAEKVTPWLQESIFMMAASNSCMNPIVYGSYAIDCREIFCGKFFKRPLRSPQSQQMIPTNNSRNVSATARVNVMPLRGRMLSKQSESTTLHQKESVVEIHEIPSNDGASSSNAVVMTLP